MAVTYCGLRIVDCVRHRTLADEIRNITGSFSIEYAVLIAIVVAALLGMSVYTKRALMGRWREVGDAFGSGRQYQPGVTVTQ